MGRTENDWRGYAFPGGHVEQGESFVELKPNPSIAN